MNNKINLKHYSRCVCTVCLH